MEVIARTKKMNGLTELGDIHPILAQVYWNRGVRSVNELQLGLNALTSFHSLKGINNVVDLLASALRTQKKIMIIGDFDADGATSTAVAIRALKMMGAKHLSYLVPNRFEYGYGLTPEIVAVAARQNPDLIITVDNGIASIDGVDAAREQGIQVLITDHHLPADELPKANAIVNPNQNGDKFPNKSLAGVGVIFYVMLALRSHLREQAWFLEQTLSDPNLVSLLDLVALGTVADVVPLEHNNRILVKQGLRRIRAGQCSAGILALLSISQRNVALLSASDLGFSIAPRLNAAGRLQDMSLGIECLLSDDYENALQYAKQLNQLNHERRLIENDMREQAVSMIESLDLSKENLPRGLCLYDPTWHQGVIGIVAGRLKDQFHRPVIAFAKMNETELKGSARSIAGFHMRDTLDLIAKAHPTLLQKFGGHAMAAGLSLKANDFKIFQSVFANEVAKQLQQEDLKVNFKSDGELDINTLNLKFAECLQDAGPWGQQFPEPLFEGEFELISQRIVGNAHLQLTLGLQGSFFKAIAFSVDLKKWPNHRAQKVWLAYRLTINEYNDLRQVQLKVEHLRPI